MIDRDLAAAIDTQHAQLSAALIYPIQEVVEIGMESALEFGVLLRDTLIREGYQAGLVCKLYPPFVRRLVIPRLMVSIDKGLLVRVDYWSTTPFYYCGVGSDIPGIQISGGVVELISELSIMGQCYTCYYGGGYLSSGVGLCGMGLVGDGNCSHYVGPALEEVEEC